MPDLLRYLENQISAHRDVAVHALPSSGETTCCQRIWCIVNPLIQETNVNFRTKFQNDFPFKEGEYLAPMLRMDWKDTGQDPMMIVSFGQLKAGQERIFLR